MTATKASSEKFSFANFPWIVLLLLIAAIALFWRLGGVALAAWDEAIYAQVSKEILQTGDWMTLHWQYSPWFEKPPLFMWITALVYRVLAVSEFSARFPSALSGLGLLAVTYFIGRLAYDKWVGLLAAAILLTCYHFLSFSRFGTMEVMLTLFTYVAVYGYLRVRRDSRWWYLVWAACALALMTKGAGGIIGPVAIALALIFDKRIDEVRSRHFWLAILLAAAIVLPWHVVMYARYGHQFLHEYIGYHVIARATRTIEGHHSSYLYYLARLIDGFFPLVLLAPFAVVSEIKHRRKDRVGSWIFLLLPGIVFLLYTIVPTRRPWYIVPLYPALAIVIGAFVVQLRNRLESRRFYRRAITIVAVMLLVIGGAYSFISLSLNRKTEEPLVKLARLAQPSDSSDRDPLILFTNTEPYHAQVSLFYSNRPIVQAYDSVAPATEDSKRYVNLVRLADVVGDTEQRIIFRKDDAQLLSAKYDLRVISETDGFVYGMIKRKR